MDKKLNILVTGSNGQLGRCLVEATKNSEDNWIFVSHQDLDIADKDAVKNIVNQNDINVIVNCAAFTNVNLCENPEYKDIVYKTNVEGVINLADSLKDTNGVLIHISTDYVFDGDKSGFYKESDLKFPINKYGSSKKNAEIALPYSMSNYIIIRTGWLYSEYGKNFLKTMIDKMKYGEDVTVVTDQVGTPTYAMDLAMFIEEIIRKRDNVIPERDSDNINEIYQYTDQGVASWYDFACAIKEYFGFESNVIPCMSENLIVQADRPKNSLMSKEKIKEVFNIDIPYWRDSLKKCIKSIGK